MQMASPFKPSVNHVDSVENFDKIWTDQAAEDSPCGTPPAPDAFSAAAAAFEVLLLPIIHITCVLFAAPMTVSLHAALLQMGCCCSIRVSPKKNFTVCRPRPTPDCLPPPPSCNVFICGLG